LAIAERMARLLDHPLRLESKAGGPTLFGVVVPRVAPEQAPGDADAFEATPSRGRVVVVDNDASMRESLSALLASWGYDVAVARDPTGALAEVERGGCELLVLDYHLNHGVTGLDVYQGVMAAGHAIPAVMISADHAAEVRQAAQAAGCEFLHKPIRPLALRSVIANILD
jgi:CheY-like chemotaxis protein